jgi:NAD(P)-dependent dehydrogenase (short-subunit alcohol dehydrogenase family)
MSMEISLLQHQGRCNVSEQRVILITGASSGNGQATARLLAQRGFTVFGTSRNPSDVEMMPGVEMLPLDVRLDESVDACVDTVLKQAGRLDTLVNNAGYELGGAIEEATLEEAKAQFETNFFGVVRMVKAVLPVMRRQGNGQIINISSLAGLAPVPFLGVYSASKSALEGYTEVLRHEVKPFNIQVSLMEPGYIKTTLARNRQYAANQISDYAPWRQRAFEAIREYEEKAPGPTLVAECVLRIIESKSPRLRYRVGKDAIRIPRLRRFLPESLLEQGTRSYFHLDAEE